jgi:UDP-N-acetylmuramoyl-tripeptide--D-alanyl-D-alanine ligase
MIPFAQSSVLFSLSQVSRWISARHIGADAAVAGVGCDSRRLQPGELFVALRGPHFDGHDYAPQAAAGGVVGLLVERELATPLPQLLVADTRIALGALAAAWRATLPGRVVGVTGSNGKTTTKEMIAAVLGQAGSIAATQGNLNNAIGLPLTLLATRDQDFLVVELGANHRGEIAELSAIARPDLALITNAGRAHLEGFGSLEGVARAKGEILEGLAADGICVLNAEDPWFPLWRELAAHRQIITFGWDESGSLPHSLGQASSRSEAAPTVALEALEVPLGLDDSGFHSRLRLRTPRGPLLLELALAGRHNLMNALAAVAVAEALEVSQDAIQTGLREVRPVAGRLRPLPARSGARLIDDSYNANPDSVRAALAVLQGLPGRRWLVLGDLAELGVESATLHRGLGQEARAAGLDRLWAVGPLSAEAVAAFGAGGRHFADREALASELAEVLGPQDLVLVKGSRSAAMDQVVKALCADDRG